MVTAAINIFIYTSIFFLIGMFKPNWALFFLKKPDRFMVVVISTVLFMVGATLYGEGRREKLVAEQPVPAPEPDGLESVPVVNPEAEKFEKPLIGKPKLEKKVVPEVKAAPEKQDLLTLSLDAAPEEKNK